MDLYVSSSICTKFFTNTKSKFTNSLPLLHNRDNHVELRSIALDNRYAYSLASYEPAIVVMTDRALNVKKEDSIYSTKAVVITDSQNDVEKKRYYTMIWLKENDCENSESLAYLLNHTFQNIFSDFLNQKYALHKNSEFIYILDSSSVIDVYVQHRFLNEVSLQKENLKNFSLDFLELNSNYQLFRKKIELKIKPLRKPLFIKIYCSQLSSGHCLTSSTNKLLAIIPYKETSAYRFEVENSIKLPLFTTAIDRLSLKLTDEENKLLQLASGAPTFIHCHLSTKDRNMFKVCHFNSSDPESGKYHPVNSSSQFTQVLSQPIDARFENCFASLHSIYIPSGFNNISKEYTNFHIVHETDDVHIKNEHYLNDGFYTEDSFFNELKKILSTENVEITIFERRLAFHNNNDHPILLSFNPQMSYLLGYVSGINEAENYFRLQKSESTNLFFNYKFSSLTTKLIKVKCDFLVNSLVGNSEQPIFKILNIDSENDASVKGLFFSFSSPHWIRMYPKLYNKITIYLTDGNDIPITFSSEKAVEGVFTIVSEESTH